MKKTNFLSFTFFILLICIYSCGEIPGDNLITNDTKENAKRNKELIGYESGSTLNTLPSCLDNNTIDSFIYYANEFTNYLMTQQNIFNLYDSIQLVEKANSYNLTNVDEFYNFVSNTWHIPKQTVINFAKYSIKVKSFLDKENEYHHPIASKWYNAIRSNCLQSNLAPDLFLEDSFSTLRVRCTFWGVFSHCALAAGSTALACAAPNPASAIIAIAEIGNYIEYVSKC